MLKIEKTVYLDGKEYYRLAVNGVSLGLAIESEDGYLLIGKKKPVPTLEDAARQAVKNRINRAKKDIRRLEQLYQQIG